MAFLSGSDAYADQKDHTTVYSVSAAQNPSALKLSAILRMLRISLEEGVLVEVRFQDGESLDGYWVDSLGKSDVVFTNATLEETGEEPVRYPYASISRVLLIP